MTTRRDVAEAVVVLGREAVLDALENRQEAMTYLLANPAAVADAARDILKRLDRLQEAIAFSAGLDPHLRRAVAAAWVGDIGTDAISALGLEEEEP